MSSYNELIHQYKSAFIAKDLEPSTIRAFLFELCQDAGIDLYTNLDLEADLSIAQRFHDGISQILDGKPMNYVLGYCWFYGYRLTVNDDVLIPRYETEELVMQVLNYIDEKADQNLTLADVGTGSGAIAISLKKEQPSLNVYASDISAKALAVADKNAQDLDCEITFLQGDMLKPLIEKGIKLDILVSNPPYIPSTEVMEHSVVDYEPHVALFGGENGLKFYEAIANDALKVLKPSSLMAFEIGYNQKVALSELFARIFVGSQIEVLKDINGKDRMLLVKI